jgi:hypothetical protein
MHARFALLLLAAISSACNEDAGEEAPRGTCSTENAVDDIDDGVVDDATAAQPAAPELSY